MTAVRLTATRLYDFIKCPHRPWRDLYGPQAEKGPDDDPFLQLLWERGVRHEAAVVAGIGPYADLSSGQIGERFVHTVEELRKGTPLIYQGVLVHEDLLGIPDLLERQFDGSYLPVDIKSGAGLEGADEEAGEEGRPKKHYAVQLALYSEALQGLGFSQRRAGRIIDAAGNRVDYDLNSPYGPRAPGSMWESYRETKARLLPLLRNEARNKPAMAGVCKLCPWHDSCKKWCREHDDLSNVFSLGYGKREKLNDDAGIFTVSQLKDINVDDLVRLKKANGNFLYRIGEKELAAFKARAAVLKSDGKPKLYRPVTFPATPVELFFDIEDDPTQDFVYLHGVYERKDGQGAFRPFRAGTSDRDGERQAWADFWAYVRSLPAGGYSVYYYSPHERTTYRRLHRRHPDVVGREELDAFFAGPATVDLYTDVILKHTDWPLTSYSVKEIATLLGFRWRDETPSGALSIKWYNDFLATGDPTIMQRILDYNEDDCRAMMAVKDALAALPVG